ncbi:unnamed protein product, partial [Sphacelaria rigidula]
MVVGDQAKFGGDAEMIEGTQVPLSKFHDKQNGDDEQNSETCSDSRESQGDSVAHLHTSRVEQGGRKLTASGVVQQIVILHKTESQLRSILSDIESSDGSIARSSQEPRKFIGTQGADAGSVKAEQTNWTDQGCQSVGCFSLPPQHRELSPEPLMTMCATSVDGNVHASADTDACTIVDGKLPNSSVVGLPGVIVPS